MLEGWVELPAGSYAIDVAGLARLAWDQGFTISRIRIMARGRIVDTADGPALNVEKTGQLIPLRSGPKVEEVRAFGRPVEVAIDVPIPEPLTPEGQRKLPTRYELFNYRRPM